jgi:hypothetical protein
LLDDDLEQQSDAPTFTDLFRSGFPISRPNDLIHTLKPVRADILDPDKQTTPLRTSLYPQSSSTMAYPPNPQTPALSVTIRRPLRQHVPPSLDALHSIDTIQTSGTCRNPRRSTILAELLSQSSHEREPPSSAPPALHDLAVHPALQKQGYPSPMHTSSFQSVPLSAFSASKCRTWS